MGENTKESRTGRVKEAMRVILNTVIRMGILRWCHWSRLAGGEGVSPGGTAGAQTWLGVCLGRSGGRGKEGKRGQSAGQSAGPEGSGW